MSHKPKAENKRVVKMKDFFQNKEQKLIHQAELAAAETDDYLAVKQYLTRRVSEIQLSDNQAKRLECYQFAYNQLVSGKYTEHEVVDMLISSFTDMSRPKAMQYLRDSKDLFSTTFNINKIFEIKVQLELNRIEQQKASVRGDSQSFARLEKNRVEMMKLIPDVEDDNHEDFEGHVIIPMFDPALLGIDPINKHDLVKLLEDIQKDYGGKIGLKDPDEFLEAEIIDGESEEGDDGAE